MTNRNSISELMRCIQETLKIDITLYENNPSQAIKIDLEHLNYRDAIQTVSEVLNYIFHDSVFWACEFGAISGSTFIKNKMFRYPHPPVAVIPYKSQLIDNDWFEYQHEAITCSLVDSNKFNYRSYAKYVLRKDFLSNTIFLIDENRNIAIFTYDRRGMDIASINREFLKDIERKFSRCSHETE